MENICVSCYAGCWLSFLIGPRKITSNYLWCAHWFVWQALSCVAGPTRVAFTYEMTWEESTIQWTSRWDTYLDMSDVQIHWFSIINSVVVVFFLAGESHHYTSSLVTHSSLLSIIVTAFIILTRQVTRSTHRLSLSRNKIILIFKRKSIKKQVFIVDLYTHYTNA